MRDSLYDLYLKHNLKQTEQKKESENICKQNIQKIYSTKWKKCIIKTPI